MGELLWRLAVAVVILLIVFGAFGALMLLAKGPWWPSVVFQTGRRPKIFGTWLALTFAATLVVGELVGQAAGASFATLLWVVAIPRLIGPTASRSTWKRDLKFENCDKPESERVAAARAVRNRIQRASGVPEIAEAQFWPQYVMDQARAEMQARYKPPGELPPDLAGDGAEA